MQPSLSFAHIGRELSSFDPFIPLSNFNHSFSITYGTNQPLRNSGLLSFGMWLNTEDWSDIYSVKNLDEKMATFHKKLIDKFQILFPRKKDLKGAPATNPLLTNLQTH